MKKLILLSFVFFSLTLFSQNNDLTLRHVTLKSEVKKDIQSNLLRDLQFAKTKDFTSSTSIIKSELIEIEKHFYLRTHYNNGFVSTTNLKYTSDSKNKIYKFLIPAGTSCTSQSCASGGGCIPKIFSPYCEPCEKGKKDCTRTSSTIA